MLKIKIKQNLILKQLDTKDAKVLFEFVNRNRDHLKKWLNWVNFIQNVDQEKKYLESLNKDTHKANSIDCGLWYDDKVIGTIGLINIDRINRSAALGYCLDSEYQHKGIITESCQKLLAFAFKDLGLHRIEIKVAQNNFRSKAVARRLGFRMEGTLREAYYLQSTYIDCDLFSKLKTDKEKL